MEKTFSIKEAYRIERTIKLCEFLICKLNMTLTGWRILNKMAWKYGFKHWPDMCNQCGFE